jgi:hypothetical protein
MPKIEKHDLNDVIEVQRIRMLIRQDKSSSEFFETMLRLINKNINHDASRSWDELTESDITDEGELVDLTESDEETASTDT